MTPTPKVLARPKRELPLPVRDLLDARDILRLRGLHKGWFDDAIPGGRVCALGALRVSITGDSKRHDARMSTPVDLLCSAIGEPVVTNWNDRTERTQAEVEAAFLDAASLALDGYDPELLP